MDSARMAARPDANRDTAITCDDSKFPGAKSFSLRVAEVDLDFLSQLLRGPLSQNSASSGLSAWPLMQQSR